MSLVLKEQMWLIGGGVLALSGSLLWWNIDRLNAKMLNNCVKSFNKDCREEKKKLFEKVNQMAKQSKTGKIKVLEIGGGTGANFEFIEESVQWSSIDPNEHCLTYYNQNRENFDSKHDFDKVVKVKFPIYCKELSLLLLCHIFVIRF